MAESENDKDKRADADVRMLREGNFCIASGVGVGAVGVASAVTAGVICPLCYIVPPVLIGVGIYQRKKSKSAGKR